MRRALRLRRSADFERVYAARRVRRGRFLVLHACPNGLAAVRVGVVAGRRHGGAVLRNRLKRRLRAAFRLALPNLPDGHDYVLLPQPDAGGSMAELCAEMERLAGEPAGGPKGVRGKG